MDTRFIPRIMTVLGLTLSALSLILAMPAIAQAGSPLSYGTLNDASAPPYDGFYINYATPCTTPVRIMPLGDSITAGASSGVVTDTEWISYRKDLWDSLTAAGYDVDFVGSQTNGQFYSGFDAHHEGHPGFTASQVANRIYNNGAANWLGNSPADVILLHIGTNDLPQNTSAADVEVILDEIDEYEAANNTTVVVILARIINRVNHSSPTTTQFNVNVATMAQARIDNGDQIIIVDMEDGAGINYDSYTAGGDMYDNLHPYATDGYTKMAAVWFAALDNLLSICPPAIISTPVTTAQVGQLYSYDVNATGSPVPTYTLTTKPDGMTIITATGQISWAPAAAGSFGVVVQANNSAGTATQPFTITVTQAPTITSTPATTAQVGQLYSYDVNATGSPVPTYTLTTQPEGMTINAATGQISWAPAAAGSFDVVVQASNSAGIVTQPFSISVGSSANGPIKIYLPIILRP